MASQPVEEKDPREPLLSELELVGTFGGTEIYKLGKPVDINWPWGSQTFYAGLYWWDECEWLRVPLDHEQAERRRVVRDARSRAAELANNHPGSAEEFTAKAGAIFRFLVKE